MYTFDCYYYSGSGDKEESSEEEDDRKMGNMTETLENQVGR